MTKSKATGPFVVANPRNIPPDRYILRIGDKVWFEGDKYDGEITERLLKGGFLVEVKHGKG